MSSSSSPQQKRPYDRESHVLIVDDDSTLLKFFKIHLNKFFSKVIVVESAKDALDTIKTKAIDLVLSDVRMPKIDGLELLMKLKKTHPDIPVLLISGQPMTSEQEEIIKCADGFLAKPFTVDELNEYITKGIDLRFVFKEILPSLKDPKHIREVLTAKGDALDKLVKKGELTKVKKHLSQITELAKKAS